MFNHPVLTLLDEREYYDEERWISIGLLKSLVAVVVYSERTEHVIRIISARKATRREAKAYEENI